MAKFELTGAADRDLTDFYIQSRCQLVTVRPTTHLATRTAFGNFFPKAALDLAAHLTPKPR
jgi:hypothetical protein